MSFNKPNPVDNFKANFLQSLVKHKNDANLERVEVSEKIGVNFGQIPDQEQQRHMDAVQESIIALCPSARVNLIRRGEHGWDVLINGLFNLREILGQLPQLKTRLNCDRFNYVNDLFIDEDPIEPQYEKYQSELSQIERQIAQFLHNPKNFTVENKIRAKKSRKFEELPGHKIVVEKISIPTNQTEAIQFMSAIEDYFSSKLKCKVSEVTSSHLNGTAIVLEFFNIDEVANENAPVDVIKIQQKHSSQQAASPNNGSLNGFQSNPTIIPPLPSETAIPAQYRQGSTARK